MDDRVLIIAEAGVNHNGSIDMAKRMAYTAKQCGADIVKFQTFNADLLASKQAQLADYQRRNIGKNMDQREMLAKLALSQKEFRELSKYCVQIGIEFLSTPFDLESIEFLKDMQNIWKIPSGEITDYPYLLKVAKTGMDIILSTGMSTLHEVGEALDVLKTNGAGNITLLHCTTDYPADIKDVNLRAMVTMGNYFHCPVGYSDHTEGIEIAIAAAAMGARIIEKHFTMDKTMEGPDNKASIEPDELSALVTAIRNVELAMGNGKKEPSESEKVNIEVARKSIVASADIAEGELLTVNNITTKRPGNGVNPMLWNNILGTKAIRNFSEDELIEV